MRRLQAERLEPRCQLAGDSTDELAGWLDELTFVPSEPEALTAQQAVASSSQSQESAAQAPEARHNDVNRYDVDVSGTTSLIDALMVINHLNHGDPSLAGPDDLSAPGVFTTDVNGDGIVDAPDATETLENLNRIFASLGGEGAPPLSVMAAVPPVPGAAGADFINAGEVEYLLARAAGATSSQDAIIAIVDRGGDILGVRIEQGALNNLTSVFKRTFAIDGAVAKARTAAFFANNEAPLTSRTIRSLSQSTMTEREVESNPTVPNPLMASQNPFVDTNPIAKTFGPGFVSPIGVGGHFPPDIQHTPPVDLFKIEGQSRDGLTHPGLDGVKGTADDFTLSNRFNVPTSTLRKVNNVPYDVPTPESYGVQSGLVPQAQGRGIATMPGGIPLFKNGVLVGGIGVFFPGTTGYATFEQGFIPNVNQTSSQRLNSNKALEAEYMALAAVGGATPRPIGQIGPLPALDRFRLPFGRIDLVGIQLEVFGPNPTSANPKPGIDTVIQRGQALGQGSVTSGENQPVAPGGATILAGAPVPEGWLVLPHDSPLGGANSIKKADVEQIVNNAIAQANATRAAIRLPAGRPTKMVIAVADKGGNVLGLFRMPDATIFSIDVAVAKARNTAYYADATAIVNADKVDDDLLVAKGAVTVAQLNQLNYKNNNGVVGTPDLFTSIQSTTRYSPLTGLAFTNRTFRFLAEPRYPSGVDGSLPPVFSILTDPGINRQTAENLNQANPTPASKFTSVMGFDAFHASRNFRDPGDTIPAAPGVNTNPLANQNGIVFFPGSTPLYKTQILVGGFGISGDGVDQDDVVTFAGQQGFAPPQQLRSDNLFYRGVRLPFQKFNRNPQGGL